MFARAAAALIGGRVTAAACHGPRAERLSTTLRSTGIILFGICRCSESE